MSDSDVIKLSIKPRRHVGVYFTATNSEFKCYNLKIIVPRLFAERLAVVYDSTPNSFQQYCGNMAYPNMAAEPIDIMLPHSASHALAHRNDYHEIITM